LKSAGIIAAMMASSGNLIIFGCSKYHQKWLQRESILLKRPELCEGSS
jgi:hypothetical protein